MGSGFVGRVLVRLPSFLLARMRGGRLVGPVVHPAVPLGRDVRCVDVEAVFGRGDDPTITKVHVIIVLVIFISVFVFAHQLAVLDLVVAP